MRRCLDRDAVAEQNIDWARKNLSSVMVSGSSWDGKAKASDSQEAFRRFTKKEMKEVRGAMADEVQADLRAVHFKYGFHNGGWLSEAMREGIQLQPTKVPERGSKNMQVTTMKLGSVEKTEHVSNSRAALKAFTKTELLEAKPTMSEAVRKDLRAVHVFAPYGDNEWKSVAQKMSKDLVTTKPKLHTMNNRGTNIYLEEAPIDYVSDAKKAMRQFTKTEMADVRGAMAQEVQDDLRAVHFRLGTDKTVLDKHIGDRQQSGPIGLGVGHIRPQSAPGLRCRVRPRSALQ